MIYWPAIIKFAGDSELTFIRHQSEWENDTELHLFKYDEADCLIDAEGNLYSLLNRAKNPVEPEPKNKTITLNDFLGLVKAHAAQTGTCCVAKLYAPSIRDALKIVDSLNNS